MVGARKRAEGVDSAEQVIHCSLSLLMGFAGGKTCLQHSLGLLSSLYAAWYDFLPPKLASDCPHDVMSRPCFYFLVVGAFVPLHPGVAAPRGDDYPADAGRWK